MTPSRVALERIPAQEMQADVRVVENWRRDAAIVTSSNAAVETLALTAAGMLMGDDKTIAHEWCVGVKRSYLLRSRLHCRTREAASVSRTVCCPGSHSLAMTRHLPERKHQGSELKGWIWF